MSKAPADDGGSCSWLSNGERCRYPGSLGHTTRGDGRWYCRGHFRCDDQEEGRRIVIESREFAPGAPPPPAFTFRSPPPSRLPYVDDTQD